MHLSRPARLALRLFVAVGLAFVYLPLLVVVVESFNPARVSSWPPDGFTLDWWSRAWDNPGARAAVWTSVRAALGATVVALLLGTSLSFAVQRFRFFGRDTLSLLVVLPIALPGIVTGIALQSTFRFLGVPLSLWTIVVGHATFCIVVVFNNVVARLRRVSRSLEEASMDLGADGVQTFRFVTFPALRSAVLAGALLAFALSFDEIIVTTFTAGAGDQTLPLWIFTNLTRPNQAPVVNVVAVLLVVISVVPIWLAQRLSEGAVRGAGAGAGAVAAR
jgi:putative spermidine/putrescine transport system permease protein